MHASKFDVCPSTSFLTLLIFLQCSDKSFGGGALSRDVLDALAWGTSQSYFCYKAAALIFVSKSSTE